jgi:hypothetical protein
MLLAERVVVRGEKPVMEVAFGGAIPAEKPWTLVVTIHSNDRRLYDTSRRRRALIDDIVVVVVIGLYELQCQLIL